jgi:serine phosphatase RsbU (regulator of sigma subunit)
MTPAYWWGRRTGERHQLLLTRLTKATLAMIAATNIVELASAIATGAATLQAEQHDLLVQLGHAAVLAVDSLRLHIEEHNLALTLQRSFLPDKALNLPGLQIAVRYVPSVANAEIGGDFYEFVELDGGELLVAIGDMAGHSIHAATVMVELRHALRAFAVEGNPPAEILDRLERVLRYFHPTEFATLCLLELDLARNVARIANAGHLPPLLVEPTRAAYLEVQGPYWDYAGSGRRRQWWRWRHRGRSCSSPTGSSRTDCRTWTAGWSNCARRCLLS